MSEKPLVSVIVPIYMVEAYLPACIESIQNQTYKNLEIILVDDGSKDNCGRIADDYAVNDARIRVIHKKNGGLSDARNAGIDDAEGEYYFFVDSDDTVEPQIIEFLLRPILDNKAELSVCNYKKVSENDLLGYKEYSYSDPVIISSYEDKTKYFFDEYNVIFTVAWNKLYPKKCFEKIRYPKGKIHEDEFTTYKLLEQVGKIAYFEIPLYNYLIRGNSIMGSGFKPTSLHGLEACDIRLNQYIRENNYRWCEKTLFLYRIRFVSAFRMLSESDKYDYGILKESLAVYSNDVLKVVWKLPVSFKQKLGYIASAVIPKQYFELQNKDWVRHGK